MESASALQRLHADRRSLSEVTSPLCSAAISLDGTHAAAVDSRGGLYLLDLHRSACNLALREAPFTGALCFCYGNREEVLYAAGNRTRVVDFHTRQLVTSLLGHASDVLHASSVSNLAVTHSEDVLILWSIADWTQVQWLGNQSTKGAVAVRFRSYGQDIAVLHCDASIGVWSVSSGTPKNRHTTPKVDGLLPRLEHLAVGKHTIAASTGVQSTGVLVLWDEKQDKRAVLDLQEPVLQLFVRDGLQYTAPPVETIILIVHPNSWRVVDAQTQHVLFVFPVPQLLSADVDRRCSRALLLREEGEIDLCDMAAAFTAANGKRRRGSTSGRSAQPLQGPRRLARIVDSRLDESPLQECQQTSPSVLQGMRSPTRRELLAFLRRFGTFPETRRPTLWRMLLRLPNFKQGHALLMQGGLRTWRWDRKWQSPENLRDERIAGVLAALATWSPILAEVPYLALLAAPFVSVFTEHAVLAFEACATFLTNWGGSWLETFPHLPLDVLSSPLDLLRVTDIELLEHLEACAATTINGAPPVDLRAVVFWPMVRCALASSLHQEEWLALWDHLIIHWQEPWLLGVAAVALLRCARGVILGLPPACGSQLEAVILQPQVLPISRLLEEMYSLRSRVPKSCMNIQPRLLEPAGERYAPMIVGKNFAMDYHVEDRIRARSQLEAARRSAEASTKKGAVIEVVAAQEAAVRAKAEDMLRVERARRALAEEEDVRLDAERRQLANEAAAKRLDRIDLACATIKSTLQQEKSMHQAEVTRVADEVRRRRRVSEYEAEEQSQKKAVANQESWVLRQLAELIRQRKASEATRHLRQDVRGELLRRECEDELELKRHEFDNEHEHADMLNSVEQLIEEFQSDVAKHHRQETIANLELDDLDRRKSLDRISAVRAAREASRRSRARMQEETCLRDEQLDAVLQQNAQRREARVEELRSAQERQGRGIQRLLLQERDQTQASLEGQAHHLEQVEIAEEQAMFEARLDQIRNLEDLKADEDDNILMKILDDLKGIKVNGENMQHRLERRQELVSQHSRGWRRAWARAMELLHEERRRLARDTQENRTRARSAAVAEGSRSSSSMPSSSMPSSSMSSTPERQARVRRPKSAACSLAATLPGPRSLGVLSSSSLSSSAASLQHEQPVGSRSGFCTPPNQDWEPTVSSPAALSSSAQSIGTQWVPAGRSQLRDRYSTSISPSSTSCEALRYGSSLAATWFSTSSSPSAGSQLLDTPGILVPTVESDASGQHPRAHRPTPTGKERWESPDH